VSEGGFKSVKSTVVRAHAYTHTHITHTCTHAHTHILEGVVGLVFSRLTGFGVAPTELTPPLSPFPIATSRGEIKFLSSR